MQASLERLRERREQGGEGGFTLIELLIVIVILGILAAIVVFAVQNLTSQSAKASCGSDLKTVETAMETYKAQVGHYPMLGASASPGPAATGDNWSATPNGTATNAAQPSTFNDGVEALFNTQTGIDGTNVGQWLKDAPSNGNLYRVWVAPTATGSGDAILVQNLQTEATPAPPESGSTPVTVGGGTITIDHTGAITATAATAGVNGTCTEAGL